MTLFRLGTLQDLETRPDAAGDRPLHMAVTPATDHRAPSPIHALLPLIRRLLPPVRDAEATQHAQFLAARIEARVLQCRAELIRTRLGAAAPAMAARLDADKADLGGMMLGLAESLDLASALVLLDDTGPYVDLGRLLQSGAPELREAALDATTPGAAANRFDRLCRSACIVQIRSAIGRLPLGAKDRAALHQQIQEQPPQEQIRSGQSRPDARLDEGEPAFLDALRRGDHAAALALLSASALVPRDLVATTVALRNQRGLVSLAWKAGYSMRSAVLLQSQLAGIAPDALLRATADGGCPLGRSEMVWQIRMLSRMLA